MGRAEALTRFHETAVVWSCGYVEAAAVVWAACDALASGVDGEAVAILASLSVRSVDDRDILDLLQPALTEVGLTYYEPNSHAGREAALVVMARRALCGELEPRALTSWTHRVFGHDRLARAERLAELDDVYDTLECTDLSIHHVDADVIAEASRIVASRGLTTD